MNSPHTIGLFRGPGILPYLEDVARLRVEVFRDWPYLYEGDEGSERNYLAPYANSPDSLFVLATVGDRVIGASTALPLIDDTEAFQLPFVNTGIAAKEVFYFGESVLLPQYRGRGIGHAFFDHREAHARALGRFRWTAFCAVDRNEADPRRPAGFRSNDGFWHKRGYERRKDMTMYLPWFETGQGEIVHPLTFWLRPLEA
ncbi:MULTISPECIES: GNAT family N-acetyltransferase [unclassified Pseudoxanthomonas]|uniref:GNAT family N-acetyltransferase n=1 Tax=unclassified Pseudoxanthomonas TaxID=2645906 RepID=UPI003076CD3E